MFKGTLCKQGKLPSNCNRNDDYLRLMCHFLRERSCLYYPFKKGRCDRTEVTWSKCPGISNSYGGIRYGYQGSPWFHVWEWEVKLVQRRDLTASILLLLGTLGFLFYVSVLFDLLFFPIQRWPPFWQENVVIGQSLWWIQYQAHCRFFLMRPLEAHFYLGLLAMPLGIGTGRFIQYFQSDTRERLHSFLIYFFIVLISTFFLVFGIKQLLLGQFVLAPQSVIIFPFFSLGALPIILLYRRGLNLGETGIRAAEKKSAFQVFLSLLMHVGIFLGLFLLFVMFTFPFFLPLCHWHWYHQLCSERLFQKVCVSTGSSDELYWVIPAPYDLSDFISL